MKARVELKTELDVKSPVFDAKFKGHFHFHLWFAVTSSKNAVTMKSN